MRLPKKKLIVRTPAPPPLPPLSSPCACDPGCPVPRWLPERVSVSLCEPDQTVMIVRLDGYNTHVWPIRDGGKER